MDNAVSLFPFVFVVVFFVALAFQLLFVRMRVES